MESQSSPHKSEDSGTLPSVTYEEKEVARVLLNNPVPVSQLQELAWQRGGLQCNLLRLRAWSTLLVCKVLKFSWLMIRRFRFIDCKLCETANRVLG